MLGLSVYDFLRFSLTPLLPLADGESLTTTGDQTSEGRSKNKAIKVILLIFTSTYQSLVTSCGYMVQVIQNIS